MAPSGTGSLDIGVGAITDEFSPDIAVALPAMAALGMTVAELRVIDGRNILDLDDAQVHQVATLVRAQGMSVVSIASPLLKCTMRGGPPLDKRFQRDVFASPHTLADQPRLARRAFDVAHAMGAGIVRVFSFWRTVDLDRSFAQIADALEALAERAWREGLTIAVENEHACNIGTGEDLGRILEEVSHRALQAVWDPANALVAGEVPFPTGYFAFPAERIAHVHAKDCHVSDHQPTWGLLGTMGVDWPGQIRALRNDGYAGAITLETRWGGPRGDKMEASALCGQRLRDMVISTR
jgi:hypothetical protein